MRICHVPFEGLHRKLLCWLALSAVVGWILLPSPATAAPRPAVKKPPRALTALWWKAYVGIPGSEAASRCDLGAGKVVFLGAFTGESASRSCTLRAGTSILVPLINVECSSLEVGTDFFGATVAERRACAARFADEFTDLFLTINGVAVGDPMSGFSVQEWPPFRFSPVEGNFATGFPRAPAARCQTDTGRSSDRLPLGRTMFPSAVRIAAWIQSEPQLPPHRRLTTPAASSGRRPLTTTGTLAPSVPPSGSISSEAVATRPRDGYRPYRTRRGGREGLLRSTTSARPELVARHPRQCDERALSSDRCQGRSKSDPVAPGEK